jgi:transmembrane sensor
LQHAFSPATWEPELSSAAGRQRPTAAHHPASDRRWPRALTWAASLAIAACIILIFVFAPDLRTVIQADYRTGVGQRVTITLPDGSVAQLNTDTAIAVKYSAQLRLVRLLRGEAAFQVRPDPEVRFRVAAHRGFAEAVGTTFL